ncbi:cytochrome c maturation protein CcmE [soil metagenome]
MALLPKSRTARRRLLLVGAIAPVLVAAAWLAFWAMGDATSLFVTPSQLKKDPPRVGRSVQLGGFVRPGSVVHHPGDQIEFTIAENAEPTSTAIKVVYRGMVPDLFREGQGVVTKGKFETGEVFQASEVMTRHDERYMPREMEKQLKASGEWRRDQGGAK